MQVTVHLQFQLKERSIACIFSRSEMLRHVDVYLVSDVSKKHSAFVFKVKQSKMGLQYP